MKIIIINFIISCKNFSLIFTRFFYIHYNILLLKVLLNFVKCSDTTYTTETFINEFFTTQVEEQLLETVFYCNLDQNDLCNGEILKSGSYLTIENVKQKIVEYNILQLNYSFTDYTSISIILFFKLNMLLQSRAQFKTN